MSEQDLIPYYYAHVADCRRLQTPVTSLHTFISECLNLQELFGQAELLAMLEHREQMGATVDIEKGLSALIVAVCDPTYKERTSVPLMLAKHYKLYLEQCYVSGRPAYHLRDLQAAMELPRTEMMEFSGDLLDRVDKLMAGLGKPTFTPEPPPEAQTNGAGKKKRAKKGTPDEDRRDEPEQTA